MKKVFGRPQSLKDSIFHYCPGCGHSITHRLIAEVIDELGVRGASIGVPPAGCAVLAYNYFDIDMIEAPHGRGPALATGLKRMLPDRLVFSYQGDGDLAAIGTAESFHAANRGENITIIFINNGVFGMTQGQMAPTTLPGQVTTTCAFGRDVAHAGFPIRVAELLSTLRTPSFIARGAVHTPREAARAKALLRRAFQNQIDNACFSLVELLSTCPTNWGLSPAEAGQWLERNMVPYYPLGVFRTPEGGDRAPLPVAGEQAWNTR